MHPASASQRRDFGKSLPVLVGSAFLREGIFEGVHGWLDSLLSPEPVREYEGDSRIMLGRLYSSLTGRDLEDLVGVRIIPAAEFRRRFPREAFLARGYQIDEGVGPVAALEGSTVVLTPMPLSGILAHGAHEIGHALYPHGETPFADEMGAYFFQHLATYKLAQESGKLFDAPVSIPGAIHDAAHKHAERLLIEKRDPRTGFSYRYSRR